MFPPDDVTDELDLVLGAGARHALNGTGGTVFIASLQDAELIWIRRKQLERAFGVGRRRCEGALRLCGVSSRSAMRTVFHPPHSNRLQSHPSATA